MAQNRSNKHVQITEQISDEKANKKAPIKFQLQLNEEQKLAKEIILDNTITILSGQAGSGKAQPLTSKVYTPSGPVQMGDLKVGDIVLGINKPTKVLGVFPQGEEDVYKLTFSDKSEVEASLQHLWTVQKKKEVINKGPWSVKTTQELLEDLKKGIEYRLPNAGVLQFQEQETTLDPYLLGILLSEGYIKNGTVTFSTGESSVLHQISNILKDTDTTFVHIGNYDYRFKKKQRDNLPNFIVEECRDLGLVEKLSYDKFIPSNYKYNTVTKRIRLLQGLIDGDGYVDKNGRLMYSTSSKQLADDIKEVFQTLGGRVTVHTYFPKYEYKGEKKTSIHIHYNLTITIPTPERFTTIPFKRDRLENRKYKVKYVSRVLKSVEKVRKDLTQCIKVDAEDSLYITDNCTVTHNTLLACQVALDMLFKKQVKKIIITRPTVSKEEIGFLPGDLRDKMQPWMQPVYANFYQLYNKEKIDGIIKDEIVEIVPVAFMRGRSFLDSVVIVDEAQNCTNEQMSMIISRLGLRSKMIICGDTAQVDLKYRSESGFKFLLTVARKVKDVEAVTLTTNHRHPVVEAMLEQYETLFDIEEGQKKSKKMLTD